MVVGGKRFSGWLLLLCGLGVSMCGCASSSDSDGGSDETKRIIFLTNGDDPFWDGAREGLNLAAEELDLVTAGYTAVQMRGNFTSEKQVDQLNQLATETDVAAIAVSVTDPQNRQIVKALERLKDRGVKILTVDSDVDRDKYRDVRFAYLGTDNIVAGRQLGQAAAILRPDGGQFATFVGNKEQGNAIERIQGFGEGAGSAFESVGSYADGADEQVAQDRVRTALDNQPELDVLVGIWAYNAHAIVKLVAERNLKDQITVCVFDARKNALDHMEDGNVDAMVVQNPFQMGYLSVKLLKALLDEDHNAIHEILPMYEAESKDFASANGDILHTELRMVVPNEESPVWKQKESEKFDDDLKFYTLEQFRGWLAERNLQGS